MIEGFFSPNKLSQLSSPPADTTTRYSSLQRSYTQLLEFHSCCPVSATLEVSTVTPKNPEVWIHLGASTQITSVLTSCFK